MEEEVELIDYLRVIWKRHWLIGGGTLACIAAALAVSYTLPKVYQGSVVLETGKLYSLTRGDQQEKVELIEDPKSLETLLKSDGVLYELKQHLAQRLEDEIDINSLRRSITIDVKTNPLIIIGLKLQDREAIPDALTFLADRIIHEHQKRYEMIAQKLDQDLSVTLTKMKYPAEKIVENSRKREQILEKIRGNAQKREQIHHKIRANHNKLEQLKEKVKSIETQISVENGQIQTDHAYRKTVEDQIKNITGAISESKKQISELDLKKASPMELLFLQATPQNHELRLADFKREINDLKQREDERQKQIADRHKQMADLRSQMNDLESQNADLEIQTHDLDAIDADLRLQLHDLNTQNSDFKNQIEDLKQTFSTLENYKAVSQNTRYRTQPVVQEKPVAPRKRLNLMLAGVIGLMSTLMLSFFVEYLETANTRRIKGAGG